MYKIRWIIKDFIVGINNLTYYFKTIWEDRDWDHEYIEKILYKKLQRVQKRWEQGELYVGANKDLKDIIICNILLKNLTENDYLFKVCIFNVYKHYSWYLEQRDREYLFMILSKRLPYWWD